MITGGYIPNPPSRKKFSFGAIFGYPDPSEFPNEFITERLKPYDQKDSYFCVAATIAMARAYQEKIRLSFEWFFSRIRLIDDNLGKWGSLPKDGAKAAKEYGFIEEKDAPFTLENKSQEYLEDPSHWPVELRELGLAHLTQTHFYVEPRGNLDLFDAIRGAIWKFRDEDRKICVGAMWKRSWSGVNKGIIPKMTFDKGVFGHYFLIVGWKQIEGESYLIAQLSNGENDGDKGFFYFPRSVVNKEFVYDNIMFKDMPLEETSENVIIKSRWFRANFWQKILLLIGL